MNTPDLVRRLESLRSYITGLSAEAPAIRNQAAILINDTIAALASNPAPGRGFDAWWESLSVEIKLLAPSNLAFHTWKCARAAPPQAGADGAVGVAP